MLEVVTGWFLEKQILRFACKRSIRKCSQELSGREAGWAEAGEGVGCSGPHQGLWSPHVLSEPALFETREPGLGASVRLVMQPCERQILWQGLIPSKDSTVKHHLWQMGKWISWSWEEVRAASQHSLQRCESDLDYQAWQFLQRKTSLQLLFLAHSRAQRLGSQWPRRSPWPGSVHQTPRDSSHVGQANLRLKRTVHLLKFHCLD